jgi:hypothetical protein
VLSRTVGVVSKCFDNAVIGDPPAATANVPEALGRSGSVPKFWIRASYVAGGGIEPGERDDALYSGGVLRLNKLFIKRLVRSVRRARR